MNGERFCGFFSLFIGILINHLCKKFNMKWWNNFHTLVLHTSILSHCGFVCHLQPYSEPFFFSKHFIHFFILFIYSITKIHRYKLILSLFKFKFRWNISNEMIFGVYTTYTHTHLYMFMRLHKNNEIFRFETHTNI